MVPGLSWQEAKSICEQHADKLTGVRWPELTCPYCLTVAVGEFEFSERDISGVLQEAWRRQLQRQRPFSRSFWLGRVPFYGSRSKYDRFLSWLSDLGLVVDRRGRSSGRLVVPPKSAMVHVKRWFGVSGVSGSFGSSGSSGQPGTHTLAGG